LDAAAAEVVVRNRQRRPFYYRDVVQTLPRRRKEDARRVQLEGLERKRRKKGRS
jgi:hypothetical protein